METVAKIISWLFLPLFMPMYALIALLFLPSENPYCFYYDCLYMLTEPAKWALIYMFSIFLVVAPGLSFIIMYRWNMISTIEMDDKGERPLPILVMLMYSVVLYLAMLWVAPAQISRFILSFPLSGVFVVIAFYFLNKWKKISIHAAGAGIATGFILAYTLLHPFYAITLLSVFVALSGLVMSARVYLMKHSLFEVTVGWLTGLFITFITVLLYP
ncbi:MAG: hypothetical protein ACO2Z9_07420 [Crocinitomicaceae bacterium]